MIPRLIPGHLMPASPLQTATRQEVLDHPAYKTLPVKARETVDRILEQAATKPHASYYYTRLIALLNTPNASAAKASAGRNAEIDASLKSDFAHDGTWFGFLAALVMKLRVEAEEELAVEGLPLEAHKGFLIDRRDPQQIAIRVKVQLTGAPADIARVAALEDKIEKHLKKPGFVVDLQFVKEAGDDVFTVGTNTAAWTTARNWVGTAEGLAHELCHLLGLSDEYDYIESHADNPDMKVEERLRWFEVQMQKPKPPADAKQGIMTWHGNKILDRQICTIADLEQASCVAARKKLIATPANPTLPQL